MCLHKILHPEIFQGKFSKKHHFEGWYFKLVDEKSQNIYAIIPGISIDKKTESHSFIQIINGKTSETYYVPFALEDFTFNKKEFDIQVGGNRFNSKGIQLSLHHQEINIQGSLAFENLHPWPVSLFSPGAMGWYAYVPFMECYHGVVSFDHSLAGNLNISGKSISFDKGRGYIEKDWGKSFPQYYIWMQSNHFSQQGISLMASIAKIPFLHKNFDGFIIGFLLNYKLYKFTTYTGARLTKLQLTENEVHFKIQDKKYQLEVTARRDHPPGKLKSPLMGAMTQHIHESLTSVVQVKLSELKNKSTNILFEGEGLNAGFEMGGEIEKIKQF